jgi:hypothetical protein
MGNTMRAHPYLDHVYWQQNSFTDGRDLQCSKDEWLDIKPETVSEVFLELSAPLRPFQRCFWSE